MNSENFQIIHRPTADEPFVVAVKPKDIPSAPLKPGDKCALSLIAEIHPEVLSVKGRKEIEGGLVHRIDTGTEGLLLAAADQEFYDRIIELQKQGKFRKNYLAVCCRNQAAPAILEGFPDNDYFAGNDSKSELTVNSRFRPFGPKNAQVRPVNEYSGPSVQQKAGNRLYSTNVTLEKIRGTKEWKASCTITEGYRHQVRCHLAWIGFPIAGDRLYNPYCHDGDVFQFYASGLEFPDPFSDRIHSFSFKPHVFQNAIDEECLEH